VQKQQPQSTPSSGSSTPRTYDDTISVPTYSTYDLDEDLSELATMDIEELGILDPDSEKEDHKRGKASLGTKREGHARESKMDKSRSDRSVGITGSESSRKKAIPNAEPKPEAPERERGSLNDSASEKSVKSFRSVNSVNSNNSIKTGTSAKSSSTVSTVKSLKLDNDRNVDVQSETSTTSLKSYRSDRR
jgi:hypothetical protein